VSAKGSRFVVLDRTAWGCTTLTEDHRLGLEGWIRITASWDFLGEESGGLNCWWFRASEVWKIEVMGEPAFHPGCSTRKPKQGIAWLDFRFQLQTVPSSCYPVVPVRTAVSTWRPREKRNMQNTKRKTHLRASHHQNRPRPNTVPLPSLLLLKICTLSLFNSYIYIEV
jgi:hypothetical protein